MTCRWTDQIWEFEGPGCNIAPGTVTIIFVKSSDPKIKGEGQDITKYGHKQRFGTIF